MAESLLKDHCQLGVGLAGKPALADATASAGGPSHQDCLLGEKPGTCWEDPQPPPDSSPSSHNNLEVGGAPAWEWGHLCVCLVSFLFSISSVKCHSARIRLTGQL